MPLIDQAEVVPYTPEEMYALVHDFEAYPQFLPWCERAWVVSRDGDSLRAGLAVRKGAVHYSFTTDNLGQPQHRGQAGGRTVPAPQRQLAIRAQCAGHPGVAAS